MKCILMNKNTKVLSACYDSGTGIFTYIYEVYNINYAPYILEKIYNKDNINDTSFRTNLSEWFDNLLHKYQYLTKFSDTRINRLCVILNRQVNKLKDIIEK